MNVKIYCLFVYEQWLKSVVDLQCAIAGSLEKSHRQHTVSPQVAQQSKATATSSSPAKDDNKKVASATSNKDASTSLKTVTVKKENEEATTTTSQEVKMEVDEAENIKKESSKTTPPAPAASMKPPSKQLHVCILIQMMNFITLLAYNLIIFLGLKIQFFSLLAL